MTELLRFGLSVLAAAVIAGGCASTGSGSRTSAGENPAPVDREQQQGRPESGQAGAAPPPAAAKQKRPWMVAPLFSSTPKLGTSLGVMGGFLHYFDDQSRVSMFGMSAQYTSTDSMKAALTAKTSFGVDHHRVKVALNTGRINNDYDDYLGTGIALKNVETALGVGGSYLYRIRGNWLAGVQAVWRDYQVVGRSPSDEENLEALGITGMKSGGVGAIIQNDTRDSDNRPTRGRLVNLDNIAFRERLGGDYDYDLYRFDLRGY